MLDVHINGVFQQVVEVATSGRGIDPLSQCAAGRIAVVVDGGGPSGNDDEAGVAVVGDSGDLGPELALRVSQDGACVVANNIQDVIVHPCLDHIAIVQAGDVR